MTKKIWSPTFGHQNQQQNFPNLAPPKKNRAIWKLLGTTLKKLIVSSRVGINPIIEK
jgi:hypothetical protein